jgi:tRNA/rRNA methyltransferase
MEVYEELKEALKPFQYVVGTTARTGYLRPAMTQPRRLADELIPISQENRVAILFGREDGGLTNEHLYLCHTIASIPTARFPSLNLAQAVMIVAYELFMAGMDTQPKSVPRLANKFELEGMYDHIYSVLKKIGFLNPQNPGHWMVYVRRFLSRIPLRAGEAQLIRGICRQMNWYADQWEKMRKEKEEEGGT